MKCTLIVLAVVALAALTHGAPSPGFGAPIVYAALPAPSSDTKVVRDALGNQATSYAYQDGHSSAVALSRSDVSKHLVAVPAPAPVVYAAAPAVHHAVPAPVEYHHTYATAPAYHPVAAPAYHAAAAYHAGAYPAYHHYAAGPAFYY